MIQITRGTANQIIVTLKEKQLLSSPYWVFRFISEGLNTDQRVVLTDTSSYKDRYNEFTFTEGSDLTLPEGIYTYYVYESATSTTDVNGLNRCEVGQAKVVATAEQVLTEPQYQTVYYNG